MADKVSYKELGLTLSDLRAKGNNKRLVEALFWETRHPEYTPYWTMKDQDHIVDGVTYPSLKERYMSFNDPTEYLFAMDVFGDWEHWKQIARSYYWKPIIKRWREELEVKMKAEALRSIIEEAEHGKARVSAAKYLIEKGWVDKEDKRGRPSKEAVKTEAAKMVKIKDEIDEDIKRMKQLLN